VRLKTLSGDEIKLARGAGQKVVLKREVVEECHGFEVARGDVELEMRGEIVVGDMRGPAARQCEAGDDGLDVLEAITFGLFEAAREVSNQDVGPGHPGGEEEGKPGMELPRLAQIELVREVRGFFADDFIANEEPGGVGIVGSVFQRDELGADAVDFAQKDAGEGHRCVAVGIAGKRCDLGDGDGAEDADGERGPVAGDAAGGEQLEAGHALVVDDREKRDVESVFQEPIEQSRGDIELEIEVGGGFEAVDERLGVEEADAADPQDARESVGLLGGLHGHVRL
jgi:hypothetical protein